MRIIICGAGQVGCNIALQLSREGHEVSLIDQNQELIQNINESLDVTALAGYASHPSLLERAGINECDMLIAVTYSDEINMVACQVAHSLFNVPVRIARIRHQDYLKPAWKELFRKDHLPIDVIISPEIEVGKAILRRLHVPGAIDAIPFLDGELQVVAVRCNEGASITNLPYTLVEKQMTAKGITLLGIVQDNKFSLPRPETILKTGDIAYVASRSDRIAPTLSLFGHSEKEARRVVIIGGGNIGYHIAEYLEREDHGTRARIVEFSKERAEEIAQLLDRTTVIFGSGLEREILLECGVENAETVIAVTNDDKVNILSSLLAKRLGCERCITLVNNFNYVPMLGNLGIDIIVNPRETTVSSILRHVRRGKIHAVHSVHDGAAEIIEAEAVETSALVGKPLGDIKLPKGVRIGAVRHGKEILLPTPELVIREHDDVILISMAEAVKKVEQFFSVSLEYF